MTVFECGDPLLDRQCGFRESIRGRIGLRMEVWVKLTLLCGCCFGAIADFDGRYEQCLYVQSIYSQCFVNAVLLVHETASVFQYSWENVFLQIH